MRPQKTQPRDRRLVATRAIVLFLPACLLMGWLTSSPAATKPPPVKTLAAEPSQPKLPPGLPPVNKPDYRPPGFVPGVYDQEVLRIDDAKLADFVAHGLRDEVFQDCRQQFVTASDDYCQKVYEATARVSPKFVDTRQRLLRGEIDSTTFQSLWHQHFLEREIALEQFMSWDDQLKLDGVPPGNDMFMTLSRWGMDVPEGFKLGLEEPPELGAVDEPDDPTPQATAPAEKED
jgi:hypothetical protein